MVSFMEILSPSFLLFPALLGSAILALVCPLVGAHLMLRRRVFLGLTLPQIAACGVAATFWLHHAMGFDHGSGGERLLAMAGSLVFTLVGMGLLAYLDRHATGSPEGRLAAAYALASALTILFIVFNPAGELEILNLLKGEVISLSKDELKLLALVYGIVYVGLVLFRRAFLLNSFDRDLSFLLTGGSVQWSLWLYVLCGVSIAVGVIMAGREVNRIRARERGLRQKLQKKNTPSAKRRLKRRRRKEGRRARDINHKIAKRVVAEAGGTSHALQAVGEHRSRDRPGRPDGDP
jgi:ABC-type Mn2+/Zn2+ transport system permease subunit